MRPELLARAIAADRAGGTAADRRRRDRRQHVEHERRSGRRDRVDLRARGRLAARRRRVCRRRGDGARLRVDPARRRSARTRSCVNPHKWLFTPFDLSVLYCRRMDVLRQAFALTPEYLEDERGGRRRAEPDGHRHPARPPVPRAEAVDDHAALRRGGAARPPRRAHAARAGVRRLGRRERSLRARRAGAVQRGVLPAARRDGAEAMRRTSASSTRSTPPARCSSRTPSSTGATSCASRSATSTPPSATSRARGNC